MPVFIRGIFGGGGVKSRMLLPYQRMLLQARCSTITTGDR